MKGDRPDGAQQSLLFYLLIGVAVAVAVAMAADKLSRGQRVFQTSTDILFWPLYLPISLTRLATVEH